MMRKIVPAVILPIMLLAGCEMKIDTDKAGNAQAEDGGATVQIGADGNVAVSAADGADGLGVSVPGFAAKVKIPGLELGGENMEIDGMKLYPGTKLSRIDVTDRKGPANGVVDMRFTSPASPDKVAAYYAAAAREQDYTAIKVGNATGTATLSARNPEGDALTITAAPAPGGSEGRILIRDKSE